jgi:ribosomal protein S27E
LGDALNAGYLYLEVKCLGCNTHQTIALDNVRRPKTKPVHELERYMRCKNCSEVQGHSLQAEPFGGATADEDFGERSTIDVVAG